MGRSSWSDTTARFRLYNSPVYLETSIIPQCVMTQVLPIGQLYQVRLFGSRVTPGSPHPLEWVKNEFPNTNKCTKKEDLNGNLDFHSQQKRDGEFIWSGVAHEKVQGSIDIGFIC